MEAPFYVSVAHTAHSKINSGIQRVTRSIAKEVLELYPNAELVEWFIEQNRFIILDEPARKKFSKFSGPPHTPIEEEIEAQSERLISQFRGTGISQESHPGQTGLEQIVDQIAGLIAAKDFRDEVSRGDQKKLKTLFRRIRKRQQALERQSKNCEQATKAASKHIESHLSTLEMLNASVDSQLSQGAFPPPPSHRPVKRSETDEDTPNTRAEQQIEKLLEELASSDEQEYVLKSITGEESIKRFEQRINLLDRTSFPELNWVGLLPIPKGFRRTIRQSIRRARNTLVRKKDARRLKRFSKTIVIIRTILDETRSSILRRHQKRADYRTALALDLGIAISTISEYKSASILSGLDTFVHKFKKIRQRIYPRDFIPPKGSWIFIPELMTSSQFSGVFTYAKKHGVRIAVVFHDALPIEFPDLVSSKYRSDHEHYMRAINQADCLLPVSSYSEYSYRKWAKENKMTSPKLRACLNGVRFKRKTVGQSASNRVKGRYILCVSTLEPRKNHEVLFKAWENAYSRIEGDLSLILVGNRYAGFDDLTKRVEHTCNADSSIQWLEGINDRELETLYREASFTVFPSIGEGFGLPILESIWYGKPCICANFGAMSEAAEGGGCFTIDTKKVEALSSSIVKLSNDQTLRSKLEMECAGRSLRTWTDYARDIGKILTTI